MLLDRRRGHRPLPLRRVASRAARSDPAKPLERALKPALIVAAALVAGCGSGHPACSARVAAALGTKKAVAVDTGQGIATCVYTGAVAVKVSVDTLPQAFRRWSNAEVERTQNTAVWKVNPAAEPQLIDGLGLGAYWVESERRLYATDGARLVTVTVQRARDPRAVAQTATRLSLGRVVEPP